MKRWPLFFIAAARPRSPSGPGWVGLGSLCGFGLVQPLPGIVAWHLDTAITLPVGVEAYGAYALGAWLTPGTRQRARDVRPPVRDRRPGARRNRPDRLPPAGRRARDPGAVAGRGPGLLPAGGDPRLRGGPDAPAEERPRE